MQVSLCMHAVLHMYIRINARTCYNAQDHKAELAASEAALHQAGNADTDAVAHQKRKGSPAIQSPSKRQRMASVQELHTSHGTQRNSHSTGQQKSTGASAAGTDTGTQDDLAAGDCVNNSHTRSRSPDSTGTATDKPDSQQQRPDALRQAALDINNVVANISAGQDGKQAKQPLTLIKEYLVKWKDKSYMHCTWVRHDDVIKMGQKSSGLKSRLRHFLQNNSGVQVSLPGVYII